MLLQLPPETSVRAAAELMAGRHVGAVLVTAADQLRGIFTERDSLERVVAAGLSPDNTALEAVMTEDPVSIGPDDSVLSAIFTMKEQRTRHLTVRDGGRVIGIISVRDLLRAVVDEKQESRHQLSDLWDGFPV